MMSLLNFYTITEYTISILNILMGFIGVYLTVKKNKHYRLLYIYFILNSIGESTIWFLKWFDISLYWQLNCVYAMVINEIFWIGLFFEYLLVAKKQKNLVKILIVSVIIFTTFYAVNYSYLESPRYPLVVLYIALCLIGLMVLFELSKKYFSTFFKQADVIVSSSLVMIYSVVSIMYLSLDSIFEYSKRLGTQVMIFQHLITIVGLMGVVYGIWLKEKITPTSSLKPSQRLRVQN